MRWAVPEVARSRPLRAVLAATIVATLVPVGGCSLFGSSRTPPDPLPAASGAIRPTAAWSASLGGRSGVGAEGYQRPFQRTRHRSRPGR